MAATVTQATRACRRLEGWLGERNTRRKLPRLLFRNAFAGATVDRVKNKARRKRITKPPKRSQPARVPAAGRATLPEDFEPVEAGTLSPPRKVPAEIPKPDYALLGKPAGTKPRVEIKTPDEIEMMRLSGRAAAEILEEVGAAVTAGVSTDKLDEIAHAATIERGGYPSPLNYHGYPKSLCTSINEVICHGIPDSRELQDGDIVNCDVTIYLNGFHGDTSKTFLVGDVDAASRKLVNVTRECLWLGIREVKPGNQIRDIGRAIERHATKRGYGVVREFVGHGLGRQFHTFPNVPHFYDPEATTAIQPGMTFTIEPMITIGAIESEVWDDGWTAVTADRSRTAQFEHTILVTENGADVLTLTDGETPDYGA